MHNRKESFQVPAAKQAAEVIIHRMQTPARFTEFLTNCISWISNRPSTEPNDLSNANFMVTRLINDMNVPLYSDDQILFEKGFNSFLSNYGPEGYHDELGVVLEAFGKECVHGYPDENTWQMYSDGIMTLLDLYSLFKLGWKEKREPNEVE